MATKANVAPVELIEIREFRFAGTATVPNNPALPVIVMRGALGDGASPSAVTALMEANGWGGTWVWQVFSYHPTTRTRTRRWPSRPARRRCGWAGRTARR